MRLENLENVDGKRKRNLERESETFRDREERGGHGRGRKGREFA